MIYYKEFRDVATKPYYDRRRKQTVDNNIYTFDIETTSLWKLDGKWSIYDPTASYKEVEQGAICYIWQFGINDDVVYYGRYLEEFEEFLHTLIDTIKMPFTVWVHNLPYETQFLRNILPTFDVFARESRKPMYINCKGSLEGIQFRDSLVLTQFSLDKCGKMFAPKEVQKKVGSLDYTALHLPDTELTPEELSYCENDCRVLYYTVKHYLDKYGTISKIPLTHTGIVRREVVDMFKANNKQYFKHVRNLVPFPAEFAIERACFWGGWCGGSPDYSSTVLYNIGSNDFNSSYPFCMLAYKYPCERFDLVRTEHKDDDHLQLYRLKLYNIRSVGSIHYIPHSKIDNYENAKFDNGKLVKASMIELRTTCIDLEIIEEAYEIEEIQKLEIWEAKAEPMDDDLRRMVVDKYRGKTELKGIDDELYADYKTFINALYGMLVTSIISNEISYKNGEWHAVKPNTRAKLAEVKNKFNNINIYSHGVFVTAYARRNLWQLALRLDAIHALVYCDTDSHKYRLNRNNKNKVEMVFEKFNNYCDEQLARVSDELGINIHALYPCDKHGNRFPIGYSDFEGIYDEFIHRGAKKYCFKKNGKIGVTVSGLNKAKALSEGSPLQTVEDFAKDLVFDEAHSGRLISTYCDNQPPIEIGGKVYRYKYGLTLRPTTYHLHDGGDYSEFLAWYRGL